MFIDKGNRNQQQLSYSDENQVAHAYTNLDADKKEANTYDVVNVEHLSASSDQYDPTKVETNTYIEMKGVKDSTQLNIEYINTMI